MSKLEILHRRVFEYQKERKERPKNKKKVYTQFDFRNDISSLEDIQRILGRKYKVTLKSIVTFRELIKYTKISSKEIKVFNISIYDSKLLYFFKNQMSVKRLKDKMIEIDLIKCIDKKYIIGEESRKYIFNYNLYNRIIDIIEENDIINIKDIIENVKKECKELYIYNPYGNTFKNDNDNQVVTTISEDDMSKLRVSMNLQKEHIIGTITDKDLMQVLMRDGRIELTTEYIKKINQYYYDNPELYHKYRPSLTYRENSLLLRKIGIRATSSICSLPKDNKLDEYPVMTRTEYMDKYFGEGNWKEYDVTSSIYRVTYFLNKYKWLPNDVDIYEMIWGMPFKQKRVRDNFKEFLMRIYFGGSDAEVARNIKRDEEIGSIYDELSQEEMTKMVTEWRTKMEEAIGMSYESEIFVVESFLYAYTTLSLLEKGIKVIQIYDAWYVEKDTDFSVIEESLKEASDYYMELWK